MTSSTAAGSTPLRAATSWRTWAPRSTGCTSLNPPLRRPIGVRTAATMNASGTGVIVREAYRTLIGLAIICSPRRSSRMIDPAIIGQEADPITLVTLETTSTNQHGEVAIRTRDVLIERGA